MRTRLVTGAAALALLLVLAGCAGSPSGAPDTTPAGGGSTPTAPADGGGGMSADAALRTADSSLGEIVVDGAGKTLYMFDNDTQGTTTSACTGQCLANWPVATTDQATPEVDGVTGAVGTIDTPDGKKQLTLNGWPLYYFAGDTAAGDTEGQGVGGIWWVLSPAGDKIGG